MNKKLIANEINPVFDEDGAYFLETEINGIEIGTVFIVRDNTLLGTKVVPLDSDEETVQAIMKGKNIKITKLGGQHE